MCLSTGFQFWLQLLVYADYLTENNIISADSYTRICSLCFNFLCVPQRRWVRTLPQKTCTTLTTTKFLKPSPLMFLRTLLPYTMTMMAVLNEPVFIYVPCSVLFLFLQISYLYFFRLTIFSHMHTLRPSQTCSILIWMV